MATMQCLGCGKRIIQKGESCPHCDHPINGKENLPNKENTVLSACPVCHGKVSKNASNCPHCGEPINSIVTQVAIKKKTSIWAWIVLFIFVVGIIGKTGNTKNTVASANTTHPKSKKKKQRRDVLKGGYYACTTKSLFNEVTSASVAKDTLAIGYLLSHGCVLTKGGTRVSIIDFGFGTSKVRAYTDNGSVIIYTNTENIYY